VKTHFVSAIKSALVPAGVRPRRVAFGLYRGLIFDLDFRFETQLYLGLWERETYRSIQRAIGRCAWAVDVGAGNGELCIRLLRSPAPGPFFAFEPQSSKVAMLRRNAALNHCENDPRLVVIQKFAAPATSDDSIAIDDLPLDPHKRGFLKVDVDGAEMAVLEGATTLLARGAIDVLVETHSAALERECIASLSERRYACTVIANAWWRRIIPEQRPIEHNRWLWATRADA
jgi:methyltransferase FkbM-like protein